MNILIAPDKFKGSLTCFEVCDGIEKGLIAASSSFHITKLPMADGGDGLSEVIAYYIKAQTKTANVFDPLFRKIKTTFLLSTDGKTAFVEMAKASGLSLLQTSERNPQLTSTIGTGQLIKAAIESGAKKIVIGIGGSATNDGGIGMASAFGFKFLDKNGKELKPIGRNLIHIHSIANSNRVDTSGIQFQVACDVKNYLYGEEGATKVYGPQKGADEKMVEELEKGMKNYGEVLKREWDTDVSKIEGSGAAGGLGAGCIAFLGAELISGIDLVMQYANAEEKIKNADVIITGEGKIDEQTMKGKVVAGIAALATKYNKPIIAVCGSRNITPTQLQQINIHACFSIMDKPMQIGEAMQKASQLLINTSFNIGSLLLIK